jgi:uridylate kinase
MKYKRILLKLSGEALMGKSSYGINPEILSAYAEDIKIAVSQGVQIGIVIGGGNISVECQALIKVLIELKAIQWEC